MVVALPIVEGGAQILTLIAGGGAAADADGAAAASLVGTHISLLTVLGGALTELFGGGNANAQRVQDAINTALEANVAANTQAQLNWGANVYGSFKTQVILTESAANAAWQAAQAAARLRFYIGILQGEVGGTVTQADLSADVNGIEAQLAFLTNFFNAKTDNETAAREAADVAVLSQAVLEARTDFARAEQDIQAALNQAVLEARTDSQSVETWVSQIVAEVSADLTTLVNQTNAALQALENYIGAGVAQANQYASTAAVGAAESLQQGQNEQLQATLSPGWAGTAESLNQATEGLVTEHPEEAANTTLVPTSVPVDGAAAIGVLAAGVRTLSQVANDCALPNCNAKNSLGKDLQSLFDDLAGGALFGLVAYFVNDPKQAAADADRVFTPIADGLSTAFQDVLGVL